MTSQQPIPIRTAKQRRWPPFVLFGLFAGIMSLRGIATFWTDYLWFSDLSQSRTWRTLIFTRAWLVVVAAVFAIGFFWINMALADRLSPRSTAFTGGPEEELLRRFQDWITPRAAKVRLLVAGFFGLIMGLGASAWWQDWLLFRHGESFGIEDPVYGNDIGLYIFKLPFFRDLFEWGFQLVLIAAIIAAALHYFNGAIQRDRQIPSGVKLHLSLLFAAVALLKAVGYYLDRWDLLYSTRGQVIGASYTDLNAQRPALNLLIFVSIVAAIILLVNIRFRGWTLPGVAVGLWLFTSVVVGFIYPAAVQRLSVQPDEINREERFVGYNIDFTRQAYGLSDVQTRSFAASSDLTNTDLIKNADTVDNIRLWDPSVLFTTYQQLQAITTYYDLGDVDVDRYRVNGDLTQVMVSARNLDEANIPGDGWINERLIYTHGFGAALSPANSVSESGQPEFLVQDIPPVSTVPELSITQPRVYFSDDAGAEYRIAGTAANEVDYPSGDTSDNIQYNQYQGEGGVELGGALRRAAFALRFLNLDTLISGQLSSDSQVLIVRNITQRLEKLLPGILYPDTDPYLVIDNGKLVWVVDMYTISDRYPYSEQANTARLDAIPGLPTSSFNYIRNSVKATVDAYDGTITLYVVDDKDPLVAAYAKAFPAAFTPGDEMPTTIREHLRYPQDLFTLQSDVYTTYHITDPREFFSTVDPWAIALDPSTSQRVYPFRSPALNALPPNERPMVPYYLLMKLPEDQENKDPSFLIMQPFTPRGRPNMVSFLVAKSDPDSYGEIIDYEMPTGSVQNGPRQMGELINQEKEIAKEFSLLDDAGSRLIQGNMIIVPIKDSLLYVMPIYIAAETEEQQQQSQRLENRSAAELTGVPEFKRVVVSFDGQIEIADTLAEALTAIFGTDLAAAPVDPSDEADAVVPDVVASLVAAAQAALEGADAALRSGDLAAYQEMVDEAAELIARANEAADAAEASDDDQP